MSESSGIQAENAMKAKMMVAAGRLKRLADRAGMPRPSLDAMVAPAPWEVPEVMVFLNQCVAGDGELAQDAKELKAFHAEAAQLVSRAEARPAQAPAKKGGLFGWLSGGEKDGGDGA